MRNGWRMSVVALAMVSVALAAGCASQKSDVDQQGTTDSAGLLGRQDDRKFDLAKDPPFTATTHFAAGQLAESQGNLGRAIEQYNKALAIDAMHVQTLYRLGVIYSQTKQHQPAVATWKQYIKATRGDATGYSNLGFALELAGQPTEAEAAYLKGIRADGKNVSCRVNYGLMLARAGQRAQAEEHLGAVLRPAEVHYNLASVLEQQGRKEAAKGEYRRALQLDPDFGWARERLAALE